MKKGQPELKEKEPRDHHQRRDKLSARSGPLVRHHANGKSQNDLQNATGLSTNPPLLSTNRTNRRLRRWLCGFSRPATLVSVLGVIILAFYTCYARQQAIEMRAAVENARESNDLIAQQLDQMRLATQAASAQAKTSTDSLELANRAWVMTEGIAVKSRDSSGNPSSYEIGIKNWGHVPAKGLIFHGFCSTAPGTGPLWEHVTFNKEIPFFMGPGDFGAIAKNASRDFGSRVESARQGKSELWLLVRIEYEDLFHHPRHSWFGYKFTIDPGGVGGWTNGPLDLYRAD